MQCCSAVPANLNPNFFWNYLRTFVKNRLRGLFEIIGNVTKWLDVYNLSWRWHWKFFCISYRWCFTLRFTYILRSSMFVSYFRGYSSVIEDWWKICANSNSFEGSTDSIMNLTENWKRLWKVSWQWLKPWNIWSQVQVQDQNSLKKFMIHMKW